MATLNAFFVPLYSDDIILINDSNSVFLICYDIQSLFLRRGVGDEDTSQLVLREGVQLCYDKKRRALSDEFKVFQGAMELWTWSK